MRLKLPIAIISLKVEALEREAWWMSVIEIEQELRLLEDMVAAIEIVDLVARKDYDEQEYETAFVNHYGLYLINEKGQFMSEEEKEEIKL